LWPDLEGKMLHLTYGHNSRFDALLRDIDTYRNYDAGPFCCH